jgi:TP901 family phage tail tape measure protein
MVGSMEAASHKQSVKYTKSKDLEAARADVEETQRQETTRKRMEAKALKQRQKEDLAQAKTDVKDTNQEEATRKKLEARNLKVAAAARKLEQGQAFGEAGRMAAEARIADLQTRGFQVKKEAAKTSMDGKKRVEVREVVATKEEGGQKLTEKFRLESVNGRATKQTLDVTKDALKATRAEAGAAGRDFIKNTSTVTAWAASVATLYGSLAILRSGLAAVVTVGAETARLQQVFSGIGGSAKDLVSDVLRLASANGRSTAEALASAIAWSRFGFTRAEVNEAVRVSLIAANVAELDAGEATAKLSAIMAAYGLRVGELAPLLGQLNQVSNTFRVTNADMLEGLTRTASVARQAGIPLAELVGLIGGTVGKTGQTGANIGNAIKSITVALSNPELQKVLREKFHFEVSVDGGNDIQNMSAILGEMFTKYQSLNAAMRQSFLFSVAGKTQANRLAALLDSYVQSQVLAINAQLHLNSAETENARIKETLKAQLQGLVTEWEKFAATQAKGVPGLALSQMTQSLHTILGLANLPGVSVAVAGMITLMGMMALKMAVTAVQMRTVAGSGGFVVNSLKSVGNAFVGLGDVMSQSVQKFAYATNGMLGAVTKTGAGLRYQIGMLNAWGVSARIATGSTMAMTTSIRVLGVAARVTAFALASLYELFLPLLLMSAGIYFINKLWNRNAEAIEAADRKLAGFSDTAEAAAKASGAAAQAARLFDTVGKSIGEKTLPVGDRRRMIDEAMTVAFRKPDNTPDDARNKALAAELNLLMDQNKVMEAQARLASLAKEQRIESMIQRGRELAEMNKEQESIRDELDALSKKPSNDANDKRKTELQKKAAALSDKKVGRIVDYSNDQKAERDAFEAADMRHLIALEKQKLVLESIRDIYAEIPALTASDKLGLDMAAKGAQLAQQNALIEELDKGQKERKKPKDKEINEMIGQGRAKLLGARQELGSALRGSGSTYTGVFERDGVDRVVKAQEDVDALEQALLEKLNAKRDRRTGKADPFFDSMTLRAQLSLEAAKKARDKIQQELEALKALADLKAKQDEIKMAITRANTGFKAFEYATPSRGTEASRENPFGDESAGATDYSEKTMYDLGIAESVLEALKKKGKKGLTQGVVKLAESGVSEEVIKAWMDKSSKPGLADQIIKLHEGGAGSANIQAYVQKIKVPPPGKPATYAGETDAERMLNVRKGLQDQIAAPLQGTTAQQDDQRITKLAAIQAFKGNELEIDKLRIELANKEKQLLIDKNVELKKSLMLASPQDMLRKIAAAQMTQGGKRQMSLGSFMAASPEMRKELQMQGQFDYDQNRLKMDRKILGERPDNAAFNNETNKFNKEEQALRDLIEKMLKPISDKANKNIVDGLDPAIKQAWEKSLSTMTTAATETAQALALVPKVVEQIILQGVAAQMASAGSPRGTRSQAENYMG